MTNKESDILYHMTEPFSLGSLVYKATNDGFSLDSLGNICEGKEDIIMIIKNNLNNVFGVYYSVKWPLRWHNLNDGRSYGRTYDPKAFIFRLRENGASTYYKLTLESSNARPNISFNDYGLRFFKISLTKNFNINEGSEAILLLHKYPPGLDEYTFLAGSNWLVSEIEIYQLMERNKTPKQGNL